MGSKGLAFLLMSATVSGVCATPGTMSSGSTHLSNSKWVSSPLADGFIASRSDGGLAVPSKLSVRPSSGTQLGAFPALSGKGGGFMSDLLLGAALFLQETQTPLDREIQEIVSQNFYSYWD